MKTFVTIEISLSPEVLEENLEKIRELKDCYLQWCVEGSTPADIPEDILYHLRTFDTFDNLVLWLMKTIDNAKAKANGLDLPYPEI